ncbi:aminotransferase class I/II-fold pyridoxal phosphate-dependent enzyme, partial [Streptomyces sp. NPDC046900]|uniref:aminotransferase class I/II-fold pyridoxal phosphate-dependent enzyme n=1 Tax=Streptomyces sp. NPDC046900 TaxID=3155473 RepID=UPI0033D24118
GWAVAPGARYRMSAPPGMRITVSTLTPDETEKGHEAVRPDAAVVSVRAASPELAVQWAAGCRAAGVAVGCFRPPSVPDGISRLRLTARADLTDGQIEHAVGVIGETRP